jgi:hypothetical protein
MSLPSNQRTAGQQEGESRKDAAHALLEKRRAYYLHRARRALVLRLLEVGTATADDVVESIRPAPEEIDPRFLGAVPGPLARARMIRRVGYALSARPSRHASPQTVWKLDDRAAALAWLTCNPDLPDPEDEEGATDPTTFKPPSPAPLVGSHYQATLF